MSLTVYTGVMGSGKSHEGTRAAIVPALLAGRRVVSNVDGLNEVALRDYLKRRHRFALPSGRVVVVPTSRVAEPRFFPSDAGDTGAVVKAGDLVVLDEAWEFWGDDASISEEHMRFVRMHRHWTDPESGVAADLVVMIQDLMGLHRRVRRVTALHLRFVKLTVLGLLGRFRVEVYEGARASKDRLVSSSILRYDPEVFPLYKSHANGSGRELVVDKRGSLFSSKLFVGSMLLGLGLLGGTGFWLWRTVGAWQSGGTPTRAIPGVAMGVLPAGMSASAAIGSLPLKPDPSCPGRFSGVAFIGGRGYAFVVEGGRWRREPLAGVVDGSASIHKGCGLSIAGSTK